MSLLSTAPRTRTSGVAGDSLMVAVGTLVSRMTGLARVLVIPAVFGATAIGDMFLAVNTLPQLLFAAFGGQALTSILVPPLVRTFAESPERARLFGRCALGMVLGGLAALTAVGLLLHRPIGRVLALGVESSEAPDIAGLLLLLIIPQIMMYGAVSVMVALQHVHGQFFLPAIAPTVENLALAASLLVVAASVPDLHLTGAADTAILLLLGTLSTTALIVHLLVQIVGVWRVGATGLPAWPRRTPELRELFPQLRSSLGWTTLYGARLVALLVIAGWAGAGGIQALQVGYLLQNLPLALIGYPIASALLPRLAQRSRGTSAIADGYAMRRR